MEAIEASRQWLARGRVLLASGVATVLLAALLFGVQIPAIEVLCGAPPPDVRFYTSATELDVFLTACGPAGRDTYRQLQLVDLVYPTAQGLFMASALALVWTKVARGGKVIALWLIAGGATIADYVENIAAWTALLNFPASSASAGLVLGIASASKQGCGWAAGLALILGLIMLGLRALPRREA